MSTSKTKEVWRRYEDFINISILVVVLYWIWQFWKNHWGKLGKVHKDLSVISYDWKWIFSYLSNIFILCDPMDCSPPGSSDHGILQARILEWVAFPSPGDLPDPGMEPGSPPLQTDSSPSEPPGQPKIEDKWVRGALKEQVERRWESLADCIPYVRALTLGQPLANFEKLWRIGALPPKMGKYCTVFHKQSLSFLLILSKFRIDSQIDDGNDSWESLGLQGDPTSPS